MNLGPNLKIFVAGHNGLAGKAIVSALLAKGFSNLVTRTHSELDLENADKTLEFFQKEKPDLTFLAAAKVGGILANSTYPVEFMVRNIQIQTNVLQAAYRQKTKRVLFLGSSCVYPKSCPQPINESYLLTSELEQTNRAYAIAKISGIELCWSYNRQYGSKFLAVIPTNLYGHGDNYDLEVSHVVPALIQKMHRAKVAGLRKVEIWGTGKAKRELLNSDDLGEALVHLAMLDQEKFDNLVDPKECPIINIGSGNDVTITELANLIADVVGFAGEFEFDLSKPDGAMQRVLDISKLASLGWKPTVSLREGLSATYRSYLKYQSQSESAG